MIFCQCSHLIALRNVMFSVAFMGYTIGTLVRNRMGNPLQCFLAFVVVFVFSVRTNVLLASKPEETNAHKCCSYLKGFSSKTLRYKILFSNRNGFENSVVSPTIKFWELPENQYLKHRISRLILFKTIIIKIPRNKISFSVYQLNTRKITYIFPQNSYQFNWQNKQLQKFF